MGLVFFLEDEYPCSLTYQALQVKDESLLPEPATFPRLHPSQAVDHIHASGPDIKENAWIHHSFQQPGGNG